MHRAWREYPKLREKLGLPGYLQSTGPVEARRPRGLRRMDGKISQTVETMVVDAVPREPLSPTNSLLTEKLKGIFAFSAILKL